MRTIKQPTPEFNFPKVDLDELDLAPELRERLAQFENTTRELQERKEELEMSRRRREDEILAHADKIIHKYQG